MGRRIGILGAGSWGAALAFLLDRSGNDVKIWEYYKPDFIHLRDTRELPRKLPGFHLPESIVVSDRLDEVVSAAEYIVLAVPSQTVRSVLSGVEIGHPDFRGIVNVAKGIETESLMRMSELIASRTTIPIERIATLSGPSHAEEVVANLPTAVVVASGDSDFAGECQELFSSDRFRVYVSHDLVGVELGGSLKNIIAIATGIADGLSMGDNTKGALLTRGLAEMTRLGITLGAEAETFAGLSGIGDLVTTCASRYSRNRHLGERIGKGEKLDDILESMSMVAEGVDTTRSAQKLVQRHNVEMPIAGQVYAVLFENKSPSEAVANLMGRELKAEIWR